MPAPVKSTPAFFDDDGKVLATKGLEVNPPWIVLKSNKFDGHYYFFNVDTETSAWSLDPAVVGISPADTGSKEEKSDVEAVTEAVGDVDLDGDGDRVGSLPEIKPARSSRGSGGGRPKMSLNIDVEADVPISGKKFNPATPASPLHTWNKNGFRCGTSLDGVPGAALDRRQFLTVSATDPSIPQSPAVPPSPVGQLPPSQFRRRGSRGFDRMPKSVEQAEEVENGGADVAVEAEYEEEEEEVDEIDENSRFKVIEGLGSGGYAVVVKVEEANSGKKYAMKCITKSKRSGRKHRDRLRVELRVMTQMPPSRFLQHCFTAFENAAYVYFILDLQTGGDLFFHLVQKISEKGWGFAEDEVRVLLAETYLGLEHMHKHNMIHRDVKVENIMLDEHGHVKLIDFGLSVEIKNDIEPLSPTGSFIYMAPEMIKEKTGGRHTDWWALGVLAYALLTGRTPWSTLSDKEILRREIQTMQITPPRRLSPPAGQLVCSLMTQDYRKRLGTKRDSDIKKASFFTTVDFDQMAQGLTAPAFEPGKRCVSEQDHLSAIGAYKKTLKNGAEGNKSPDGSWFMGLPNASEYLL